MLSLSVAAAALVVTSLAGCLKNNDNANQPGAGLSVLQASPTNVGMNLYINDEKINSQGPITYPAAGFQNIKTGNYVFSLVNASTGDTIAQAEDSLQSAYYSLIVFDTGYATSIALFQDEYQTGSSNSGYFIRYLQLSPDAGTVNFYLNTQTDTMLVSSNREFADFVGISDYSVFNGIDEGVYNFTAVDANNGDTLASLANVAIPPQNANVYTLMLRGLRSHTDDSLALKLTLQANY